MKFQKEKEDKKQIISLIVYPKYALYCNASCLACSESRGCYQWHECSININIHVVNIFCPSSQTLCDSMCHVPYIAWMVTALVLSTGLYCNEAQRSLIQLYKTLQNTQEQPKLFTIQKPEKCQYIKKKIIKPYPKKSKHAKTVGILRRTK